MKAFMVSAGQFQQYNAGSCDIYIYFHFHFFLVLSCSFVWLHFTLQITSTPIWTIYVVMLGFRQLISSVSQHVCVETMSCPPASWRSET